MGFYSDYHRIDAESVRLIAESSAGIFGSNKGGRTTSECGCPQRWARQRGVSKAISTEGRQTWGKNQDRNVPRQGSKRGPIGLGRRDSTRCFGSTFRKGEGLDYGSMAGKKRLTNMNAINLPS